MSTQEILMERPIPAIHDIIDDDVDDGIEPIQNSKAQKKMQIQTVATGTIETIERPGESTVNLSNNMNLEDSEIDGGKMKISPVLHNKY